MQLSLSEALPTGGARQELGIRGWHSPGREPHISGDLSLSSGPMLLFLEGLQSGVSETTGTRSVALIWTFG